MGTGPAQQQQQQQQQQQRERRGLCWPAPPHLADVDLAEERVRGGVETVELPEDVAHI